MSAPDIGKQIRQTLNAMNRLRDRVLPVKVGVAAVAQVKDNFRKGGFDGQKWDEPYRRRLSFNGAAGKYGPLLSGTNSLMSANAYKPQPGKVMLYNPKPYALIQNEGGMIKVTAKMKRYFWYRHRQAAGNARKTKGGKKSKSQYNQAVNREADFWKAMALKRTGSTIRIPARKFLGESREMRQLVNKIISKELQLFIQNYGKSAGTPR